jgi:CDGSH-type Zn-finger protein
MARLIRFDAAGPIKIDPATLPLDAEGRQKPIWICACGLSRTFPFCDKAHKACAAERTGVVYTYDRVTGAVVEERRDEPAI